MNHNHAALVFFYGTLKQGHYNHTRFNLHDPEVGRVLHQNAFVNGFSIEISSGLPRAVRRKGGRMTGDVYAVRNMHVLAQLIRMEIGAGYTVEGAVVHTADGDYECLLFPSLVHEGGELVETYTGH